MSDKPDYMMDRAHKRLRQLHSVTDWLLQHWEHIPDDLYRKNSVGDFISFDVRQHLVNLVNMDFANAITPTTLWRKIAEFEGLTVDEPDTESD